MTTNEEGKIQSDIEYIKRDVSEIKDSFRELKAEYVLRTEFNTYRQEVADKLEPLKKIVYGAVSLILTAVASGLLFLIIKH